MKKQDFDNYFKLEKEVLIIIKRFLDDLVKLEDKYKNTIKKFEKSTLSDDKLIKILPKFYDSDMLSLILVSGNKTNEVRETMLDYDELTLSEKKQLSKEIADLIKKHDKLIGNKK